MAHMFKLPLMVFTPILIGVAGQLCLKTGMQQIGTYSLIQKGIVLQYLKILFNPFVFFGLVLYFTSTLFWLYLISRVPLSFAYPMLSISYVLVAIASLILFHERISVLNWVGITVILVGVCLIAQERG
ncbi:MAG: EamA family transporter [Candidatus Margulisiibacteriota bacterium]